MDKKTTTQNKTKEKKPSTFEVNLPQGTTVSVEENKIKVKGAKGELTRKFQQDNAEIKVEADKVIISATSAGKTAKAKAGAIAAHIRNMVKGVNEGITYKMKIVYSHFPMSVKVSGDTLSIDNFLGEKHPRKVKLLKNVTVEIKGQEVTVKGIDPEAVAQTAANIEQATRIKERDHRVFQDGIYITNKDGHPITH